MLPGREREAAFLNELLNRVRGGHSAAIVVHGEAGVGKTALLNEVVDSAPDLRVVRGAGVESEMELPFAGLQQLCVSMLDHLEHLPPPQADALRTAFGLVEGPAPDRFLIGLAVLSLLSEAAGPRPLVCVVDDCQWLDRASAQALAFAARRIHAEGVLLAFAAREPSRDLEGIPGFGVEGLRDPDARALLRSVVRWPLDEQIRERILAETRGNPLALIELPRGLSPAELAGGFGLPQELSQDPSLAGRIRESFVRRAEALPEATRLLVLLAAAEPAGDPALLWRAAARLGLARDTVVSAEEAGLLKIGGRVVFRHPLVRSAVYGASSPADRRRVHVVLAAATDPDLDPDRRAWHLAQAAVGPDEEVAAELERSAALAQGRGGLAAAAAFLDAFDVEGVTIYTQGLAELVEAAARAGVPERAADALARLDEMTRASGTDWAAGVRARSQALVSEHDAAEPLYREAIERFGRTRVRPQLARAHLVYGEWLRRENRRVDARQELLRAFEMFADMGMEAFSERTRRELAATGEKIRRQAAERLHDLTSQEAQIARLAREGLTNQEIGFQLYLSARTVEWHLRKVFTKLGITSRRQLGSATL